MSLFCQSDATTVTRRKCTTILEVLLYFNHSLKQPKERSQILHHAKEDGREKKENRLEQLIMEFVEELEGIEEEFEIYT